MASNAPFNGRGLSNETAETAFSPLIRPSSLRNLSLSSSPSFSSSNSSLGSTTSFNDDDHLPFSPSTPLRFSGRIPFSWEKLPGIPKQSPEKNDRSMNLLPLPPAGNGNPTPSRKKFSRKESVCQPSSFRKDPFFAALVECSKDNDEHDTISNFWKSSRLTRTLSDRLGFVGMYTSCKTTCAVSQSIVYLPRSTTHAIYTRGSR